MRAPLLIERCIKPMFGLGGADGAEIERGLGAFARAAPVLDEQLGGSRFVAGPQLTIADFSVGAILNVSEMAGLPMDDYPDIRRWHEELTKLPSGRQAMVSPPCNPPD